MFLLYQYAVQANPHCCNVVPQLAWVWSHQLALGRFDILIAALPPLCRVYLHLPEGGKPHETKTEVVRWRGRLFQTDDGPSEPAKPLVGSVLGFSINGKWQVCSAFKLFAQTFDMLTSACICYCLPLCPTALSSGLRVLLVHAQAAVPADFTRSCCLVSVCMLV